MWFTNKRLIETLEHQITDLKQRILALERENSRLVDRLLAKYGVPEAQSSVPSITSKTVESLLSTAAMVEEDEKSPELTDNRKQEPVDEFAS
jgi:hypothetical protein